MVADHHGRIRIGEWWFAREKVKCCAGKGILICAAVKRLAGKLFRRSVGD